MEDNWNYNEYNSYNEQKNKIQWGKIILSIFVIIIIIIIILLLLKSCKKTSLKDDIITASHEYYEKYPRLLPSVPGECVMVTLGTLEDEGLIKNNKYETCDKDKTYVNVCYLENKNYHYAANLSCQNEYTNYGLWKDGNESLLTDNSDVRFLFQGEKQTLSNKYFYPKDVKEEDKVKEYYASKPNDDYTYMSEDEMGYKWYIEKGNKVYWNRGEYSSTQPSGYTKKGSSKEITNISETVPESASYRKISNITLYRTQNVARPYVYWCADKTDNNKVQAFDHPCSGDFPRASVILFTCDGKTDAKQGTVCSEWTSWSTTSCSNSVSNGINCETKKGYKYTDTMWQWYKIAETKTYYPSGSTNESSEKTYYVEKPVDGAIKDETTRTKVNKYYKLVEEENGTVELMDSPNWFNGR